MAKKEFRSGLDNLLQSTIDKEESIPKKNEKIPSEKLVEVRATFIIDESQLELLKAIAYWERSQIKQILEKAISQFIMTYTKEDIHNIKTAFNKRNHANKSFVHSYSQFPE